MSDTSREGRSFRIDTYDLEPRYTVHELIDDETGVLDRQYVHPAEEPGDCRYCDDDDDFDDEDEGYDDDE